MKEWDTVSSNAQCWHTVFLKVVHFSVFLLFFPNTIISDLLQEYTLAHIDKPDTLAGAEKALKKHEDFVSTMEANEDKIDGALQAGQRLVDNNNLYSGKVQEKMGSIQERSVSMVFGQHSFKWSVDRRAVHWRNTVLI